MIITLCGSARFEKWFHAWNEALGLAGHAAFGLCAWPSMKGEREWYTQVQKLRLDAVHYDKIHASDAVLFLNVMAYMGESTLAEFNYAREHGKDVYFLESWGKGFGIYEAHYEELKDQAKAYGIWGKGSPIDTFGYPHASDLLGEAGANRSSIVRQLHKVGAL